MELVESKIMRKLETFASQLDAAAQFKLKQSANIATFMRML